MKKIIFLYLISTSLLIAQHHPDLNWKIINTENFNIIFDERLEEDAIRVASTIEEIYAPITKDMDVEVDRYEIILTAENVISNGYVSTLGKKSVFYPTPPQDYLSGSSNWYDFLTVHEYRHVVQQSKIRDSVFQKVRHFLFGDLGYSLLAPYIPIPQTLPRYFYEGDAVLYETLLTNGGRGRQPSFERTLRTNLINDKNYSFSKTVFGSKRNNVPNNYESGYFLMTYLKRKYGTDIISRIANFAANYPLPFNFSVACYFITGYTMPEHYKKAMKELKDLWIEQDEKIVPTESTIIPTKKGKVYTNYTYPVLLNKNRIAVVKTGLNNLYDLTLIDSDGSENSLNRVIGSIDGFNNLIAYTKFSSHNRWLYREYSDIYILDTETNKERRLTTRGRYFAPNFSKDGGKIVAIENSTSKVSTIKIFNSRSGKIIQTIDSKNYDISTPIWSDDGKSIVAFFTGRSGKFLGQINLESEEITKLTEVDFIDRTHPEFYNNYILFRSSYSGIDNIHAIDIETKEEFRVLSSRFGSDFPQVRDDKLIFSNYTLHGYRLEEISLDPNSWERLEDITEQKVEYFDKVLIKEQIEPIDFGTITPKEYDIKQYSKAKNSIDIHSWYVNPLFPLISNDFILDTDEDRLFDIYETVILSSNKLETFNLSLYNHINIRSERFDFGIQGSYSVLYPIISFDSRFLGNYTDMNPDLEYYDLDLGLTLPIIINKRLSATTFHIGIVESLGIDLSESDIYNLELGYFLGHTYKVAGSTQRALGLDLSSNITISYYHDLEISDDRSLRAITNNSIRGFLNRDNFRLKQNHLWDISDTKQIEDYSPFDISINKNLYNYNSDIASLFRLDYIVPVLYPDLSIFNWVYFTELTFTAGYEAMIEWSKNYYQAFEFTATLYHRLLRIDVFDFYSDIKVSYSLDSDRWEYKIMPIMINMGLN